MQIIPSAKIAAGSLSSNPVQQHILVDMFNYFNKSHDDQYDVANFIAALLKGVKLIEERVSGIPGLDMKPYIDDALQDWKSNKYPLMSAKQKDEEGLENLNAHELVRLFRKEGVINTLEDHLGNLAQAMEEHNVSVNEYICVKERVDPKVVHPDDYTTTNIHSLVANAANLSYQLSFFNQIISGNPECL